MKLTGVSDAAQEILTHSWRGSTKTKYEGYLRKWKAYCELHKHNWLDTDVTTCVNFLAKLHLEGLGYSGVNTARSALSAVTTIPGGNRVGEHPLVKRLLRGIYSRNPPTPRYDCVWDVNLVFKFLRDVKSPGELSLKELSLYTVTLLLILSAERCQTIAQLTLDGIVFNQGSVDLKIKGLLKTSRPGYHRGNLSFRAYPEECKLCVVTLLREYVNRTSLLRVSDQPKVGPLFISFSAPHKPVSATTVGRWTKLVLAKAGVDIEKFSAHSTRAAAVSAAKTAMPVEHIIKQVGWASESMFAKFYDKPIQSAGDMGNTLLERFRTPTIS